MPDDTCSGHRAPTEVSGSELWTRLSQTVCVRPATGNKLALEQCAAPWPTTGRWLRLALHYTCLPPPCPPPCRLDARQTARFALVGATLHGPFFYQGFKWLDATLGPAATLRTVSMVVVYPRLAGTGTHSSIAFAFAVNVWLTPLSFLLYARACAPLRPPAGQRAQLPPAGHP